MVPDIAGNMTFANHACCDFLRRSVTEIKDMNFYSVFAQPDQRGRVIENYLKLFDRPVGEPFFMTICIAGGPLGEKRKATCSILRWDHRRLLVTQLV